MLVKLLCDDGAEFHGRIERIAKVSGIKFRGRHFFFRNFKVEDDDNVEDDEPFCEFKQGIEITLIESEVTQKEKA